MTALNNVAVVRSGNVLDRLALTLRLAGGLAGP